MRKCAHRVQLEDDAFEVLAEFAREHRLLVRRHLQRAVAELRERVQQRRAAEVRAHALAGGERERREVGDALPARHPIEGHLRALARGRRTGTGCARIRHWLRRCRQEVAHRQNG